jgi:curved DNA-binding protein CbpA
MENIFIKFIHNGKIKNLEELKKAYWKLAKKTHPDSIGSDKFVRKFIQFKENFEEAKKILISNDLTIKENEIIPDENFRFLFFLELQKIYSLEAQFLQTKKNIDQKIKLINESAFSYFIKWKKDYNNLYISAIQEYDKIKKEKRKNILSNLRKPSLFNNLRPVFFNLFKFHITGLKFYQKQLRSMMLVIDRLEENQCFALKDFLLLLIKDMENGPAIFG